MKRRFIFLVWVNLLSLLFCCSACTASAPAQATPLPPTPFSAPILQQEDSSPTQTEKLPLINEGNEQIPSSSPSDTPIPAAENPIVIPQATPDITATAAEESQPLLQPAFDRFVDQVKNGNPNQLVGVYIEGVLALRVVQQPPEDANYVSNVNGVVTQFLLPYQISGNIGLLAHNYLSGSLFFDIKVGDIAQLIYGDGNVDEYVVSEYHEYQALSPNSPNSDFIDLTTGEKLSAGELFNRIYTGSHRLVFQTCIAQDEIDTWGRLFVISFPY